MSSVALSVDGRHALSGSYDRTIKLWDLRPAQLLYSFRPRGRRDAVAMGPDGRFALSGSSDRTLRLWDLDAGLRILQIHRIAHAIGPSRFSRSAHAR